MLVHKDYYYQESFIFKFRGEIPNKKGVSDTKSEILYAVMIIP